MSVHLTLFYFFPRFPLLFECRTWDVGFVIGKLYQGKLYIIVDMRCSFASFLLEQCSTSISNVHACALHRIIRAPLLCKINQFNTSSYVESKSMSDEFVLICFFPLQHVQFMEISILLSTMPTLNRGAGEKPFIVFNSECLKISKDTREVVQETTFL